MNPSTHSADIEASAAAWFAKRESDDWNAAAQAQLQAWLDASTAHRIAFVRIVAAWERSGRLKALGAGVSPGTIPPRDAWSFTPLSMTAAPGPPQERAESLAATQLNAAPSAGSIPERRAASSSRFLRRSHAIAALLVLATAAGALWYYSTGHAKAYSTQIGAVGAVALSDGSQITLNTDSQIRVEVDRSERHVKLDRGEAFFAVAKDAGRPFIVEVADKRVIAVGTQFSVRRDHDDMRVLVTEGRVRIENPGVPSTAAHTQIAAGSEARTAKTAVFIDQPAAAQVEQLLSWRTGHIIFRDTALADAVAEFNRYSVRKIVIDDPAIAGIRVGGNFRSGNVDAFVWLLQSGFPIRAEQRDDRIILTRR